MFMQIRMLSCRSNKNKVSVDNHSHSYIFVLKGFFDVKPVLNYTLPHIFIKDSPCKVIGR